MRPDAKLRKFAVVGPHPFVGGEITIGNRAKNPHERELMFGRVDLAAEEGNPGAVTLGLGDQAEGVVRGACAAAQDPHDDRPVVGRQLLLVLEPQRDEQRVGLLIAGDTRGERRQDPSALLATSSNASRELDRAYHFSAEGHLDSCL